ncbi:glycosyltransferase family 2 protein [Methyloceanibacter sp.]|uniref:glycosyltransferase family 2 protein n=1 Tax=Methyloceanibacter sp. TaxID=1965321 RepID=UPI003D6CCBCF
MPEQPLVSVIVCVRDGERFLDEALDSIAAQEFTDLETIVIDDGSTDDSAHSARKHSFSPVVVSQPALGIGAAINHGIRLARGRYLAFLDCDDVWPSDRLIAMIQAIERDLGTDYVFGSVVNTDERLNPINTPQPARLLGSLLIKRASVDRIGAFRTDVAHAGIVDWMSRAEALGLRFEILDRLVLLRRIHGSNLGSRDRPNARRDLLRVIRDHHRRTRS